MSTFCVIAGEFHREHSLAMIEEVQQELENHGHKVSRVVFVPGTYEVPLALERALAEEIVDGAVVLGIIERGETAHGIVMANAVMSKILDLQLKHMKPVGIGIVGPEVFPSQIQPRVRPYAKAAASAAIKMLA